MKNLCPLIKEKCSGNQCMMWKDENCLFISFMERFAETPREFEGAEVRVGAVRTEYPPVPREIQSASAETLASWLVEYAKRELKGEEAEYGISVVSEMFWNSKGLESRWSVDPETRLKIQKAEMLARSQLQKEQEARKKEQIEVEMSELPSLVVKCVDWARSKGLTNVTKSDIDVFLMEKRLEIMPTTKNALYANTKLELKKK